MDRVNLFRDAIKSALTRWSQVLIPELGMENALVFDEKTDNYVYIYTGWKGGRHINATIAHIGIRDGKIHVFYDGIEASMVPDLLKAGILENEIVIERHPPFARHLTPFAIA